MLNNLIERSDHPSVKRLFAKTEVKCQSLGDNRTVSEDQTWRTSPAQRNKKAGLVPAFKV